MYINILRKIHNLDEKSCRDTQYINKDKMSIPLPPCFVTSLDRFRVFNLTTLTVDFRSSDRSLIYEN